MTTEPLEKPLRARVRSWVYPSIVLVLGVTFYFLGRVIHALR